MAALVRASLVPELLVADIGRSLQFWCRLCGFLNLQIAVSAVAPILAALAAADWPLFMAPERKWYRAGAVETGVGQFLVQDPDGYLVRFAEPLGERSP